MNKIEDSNLENIKEYVKKLCADNADIMKSLLSSVMKSKKSNQKMIKRERKGISCPYCGSISIKQNGTKEVIKTYKRYFRESFDN